MGIATSTTTSVTTAAGTTDAITTHTEYDAVGNVVAQLDGLNQRTEMAYDNLDRLILSRDPETPAGEAIYTYDAVGNLLSLTDAATNTTLFGYDARHRQITETNALNETRTHTYDDVGNRITTTDREDRTRQFTYDALNRQTQETWLDELGEALRTTERVYDAAGQLIAVSDPDSAYQFGYDELGRRIQVSNAGTDGVATVVLDYDYDAEGNLISVRDTIDGVEGGTTTYSYDLEDRVDRITQSGTEVDDKRVDFTYDPIGQFESISRYSDLADNNLVANTTYSYDDHNRLDYLGHSNDSSEVAFYDFAYDDANRISQITDIDGATDYSYNRRNELTGADHSDVNNPDETYDYDANGNRVSSSLHGTDYDTGANNQLLADGVYTYDYDDVGNLIRQSETATGNVRNFEWDYLNRLVAVIDQDNLGNELQRVEYTYDVMNRRIAKTVDVDGAGSIAAETLNFVYNRENVLLEFEGNSTDPSQRYLHGPRVDQVLAQEDTTGNTLWHLSDHLGTVKDLADDTGMVVNHRTYDSYGNLVAETDGSFDSRYEFTGREFDEETGLNYYRARYYNGEIGRFISEDPIGFVGNDSNLYRYVKNAPISYSDPTGNKVYVGYRPFPSFGEPGIDGIVEGITTTLLRFSHTTIILEPDNPCDFEGDTNFINGVSTLSGWPTTVGTENFPIELEYLRNLPEDNPQYLQGKVEVTTPSNLNDNTFIQALIDAAESYDEGDNAFYWPLPGIVSVPAPWNRFVPYNSNSFVSGVIREAGGTPPNLNRFFPDNLTAPGYGTPVPIPYNAPSFII